jgi:hypothetical protein
MTSPLDSSFELKQLVCRSALGIHNRQRLIELCSQDALACYSRQYQEGLQGLFAHQLSTQAPDIARPDILEKFQLEFGHSARALGQLQEVDQALQQVGLEAVVFKGGSFHPQVYPTLGTRPVSDLDLWVQPKQLPQIEDTLVSLKYQRLPGVCINFHRDNGQAIDLHTDPLSQFRRVFPLSRAWWESRQPLGTLKAIRQLPLEEALIVTALHGLKHAFRRLMWLLDVALLRRLACPIRTAKLARQLGCQRMLDLCDALIDYLFLDKPLNQANWNRWELHFLEAVRSRTAPESAGMLLPLFSEAPWWRKLFYAVEAAYAEGATGWSRVGRLFEIFSKLLSWSSATRVNSQAERTV